MRNKYLTSHASQLHDLEAKIAGAKSIAQALKGSGEAATPQAVEGTTGNGNNSGGQDRTVASPDFGSDVAPDITKEVNLETKTLDEFNASRTPLGGFYLMDSA